MIWAYIEVKGKIVVSKFDSKADVPSNHTIIDEGDIQDLPKNKER